jgi:hypothetical protein
MTTIRDHAKHPEPTPPTRTPEWVVHDDETVGYPPREPDIVARFTAPTGVEVQLMNLSRSSENPDIAVIYESPRVSRGRSPVGTMLSPLELFLAFEPGERTPDVLVRHHRSLAQRGVYAPSPRALPLPLWAEPNQGLPTDYGDVDLCEGDFAANWNYFSLGHGVVNPYGFFELWTGWSVVTGGSPARSCAICVPGHDGPKPDGLYEILNREAGGQWESIYTTIINGLPGHGVGFQTYGPGEGRTRIRITTENDEHGFFFAGASWGEPEDWITS